MAALILFPGTPSQVTDGGPGDATGVVNDMIVIDPGNPILVPGTADLYFSGMVQHAVGGGINVGQAAGLRALLISEIPAGLPGAGTPAVLHNTGTGTFALPGPVDWVRYDYTSLNPAAIAHMADLAIHFQGPLDTTPGGGTLGSTDQRLGVSVQADTWWEWAAGAPDVPISAGWSNPGMLNAPITASGWNASVGDYDISPGRLLITLDDVVLEAGERFEFPSSISAGLIPEPGSALLLLMAVVPCLLWRRRGSGLAKE